jgi:hypothetical protein
MHKRSRVGACLLAGIAAVGIAAGEPQSVGSGLLRPFKEDLLAALRSGLESGPAAAIGVCRMEAPGIAAGLSRDGVRMGRSSHRLRNPANAPPEWVAPVLADFAADAGDREPREIELPDGRAGYVEPIITQPLCLACHGEQLAPDVQAAIDALYPEDRAVGLRVGDLRGVFWVEYPKPDDGP